MLYDKIKQLYPSLTDNGKGDYIAKWEHPTLPRPTDEELA